MDTSLTAECPTCFGIGRHDYVDRGPTGGICECDRCRGTGSVDACYSCGAALDRLAECHACLHAEAKHSAESFATLAYVGQMHDEMEDGSRVAILHGNCSCKSTICRVVAVDSAEAVAYRPRGKVAA